MKMILIVRLIVLSLFLSTPLYAAGPCKEIFATQQTEEVRKIVDEDGFKQWLLWEQKANLKIYEKPSTAIRIPAVIVSRTKVKFETSSQAPQVLIDFFKNADGNFLWAKHPYNTHDGVPFFNALPTGSFSAFMTASRSLVLDGELRGFTIKLPTDRPHGPDGEWQPAKIETNDDVDSALIHSNHFENVDKAFGPDPKLVMLNEVMTLSDKKTGIGMIVRDVRALNDGNYYLPALSIPYVGREIAKINGVDFELFFKEHYAELLGEAKARLLLRTGLQMETPNPQNMLIQFDRNLKPTGKIFFRDISDAFLVKEVAEGLGYDEQIAIDKKAGYRPVVEIVPYWSNSAWRLDEAGEFSVSISALSDWGYAHNKAYVDYISNELGLSIQYTDNDYDELRSVYEALKSEIGQAKLRQYRMNKEKDRSESQTAKAS